MSAEAFEKKEKILQELIHKNKTQTITRKDILDLKQEYTRQNNIILHVARGHSNPIARQLITLGSFLGGMLLATSYIKINGIYTIKNIARILGFGVAFGTLGAVYASKAHSSNSDYSKVLEAKHKQFETVDTPFHEELEKASKIVTTNKYKV